jgi:sodium-dependent dicarboxylate transporter 2/3/5
MFGIYAAILKTNLPKRIAGLVLRWAKTNSYKVVFGFVFATTLLSMVMSNIPTCMIFCGVAIGLLKGLDNEGIGSRLGKALFIGIPAGSVMGGTACLAGNAMNVVAVGMVQQFTGYEITFASWLCVGFPTAIIMAFIIAATLCLIFKPEKLTQDIVDATIVETRELGKLEVIEKKVIVMLVVLVACWIASSWITWLNTNVVALIGLIIMHFPGVKILEADELCKNTNWDIIVFMGCLMAFMTGFQSSGAASVIVDFALGNASSWSVLAILLAISVVPCIAHICIPSGPAVLLLTMIPLLTAGTALGINPFVIAFIVSVWTGVQFMLPIDGLWMISYGFAYFKTSDLLKWGIFPTVALIILTVTLVPALVGVFGIGV